MISALEREYAEQRTYGDPPMTAAPMIEILIHGESYTMRIADAKQLVEKIQRAIWAMEKGTNE